MIKIYFKEAKEKYDSVFDLLSHYLSVPIPDNPTQMLHPATYWEDTGELQCKCRRNRSFDDLLLLAQHYMPEATIEDIVNALYQFNKGKTHGLIACIHCENINRFVNYAGRYSLDAINNAKYIFTLFPPWEGSKAEGYGKNSQWELSELKAMIKE